MKKVLFVLARYPDHRQNLFETIISPRNKEYCDRHNFKYVEIKYETELPDYRSHPSWYKMYILEQIIDNKKVDEDDIVTVLDGDMYIVNLDKDYVPSEGKNFTYSIDNGNTHCMGNFSLRINDWSKKLIKNILDEKRYKKFIDHNSFHEAFNNYSSFWRSHYEQASWYSCAGIKRHSWTPFLDLPNYGFHSAKDEHTLYSLDELLTNVELLPAAWNVTANYESTDRFNINKVPDQDVIIRHFAGGQPWDFSRWKK